MSYECHGHTISNHPGCHNEDEEPYEDNVHRRAALSPAEASDEQNYAPNEVPPPFGKEHSHGLSKPTASALDTNKYTLSSREQEDSLGTTSAPRHSPGGAPTPPKGYESRSSSRSNNLQQLAEAQRQYLTPTLNIHTTHSSSVRSFSRGVSPSDRLKNECEKLRDRWTPMYIDGSPRTPEKSDFPQSLSLIILPPLVEPAEHCIILLHHWTADETSLENLAKTLRSNLGEGAFVIIRAPHAALEGNSGYHWADPDGAWDLGFSHTCRVILEDVIKGGLMARCSFRSQNIVILGHGQGGMAALAAAATWHRIEFGGTCTSCVCFFPSWIRGEVARLLFIAPNIPTS